jgi:Fe2+ transport system protein FeoA
MRGMTVRSIAGLGALVVLSGCVAAEKPTSEGRAVGSNQALAGWYMQHAGQGTFQPCGQPQPLQVSVSADLHARATAFGLDEDTPIYVRVTGVVSGSQIAVSHVDQFGSPIPVRNCAMNGVVIPSAEE